MRATQTDSGRQANGDPIPTQHGAIRFHSLDRDREGQPVNSVAAQGIPPPGPEGPYRSNSHRPGLANGLAVPAERLGKPGRRLGVMTKKSAGDALMAADDDRQDERTPS